MRLGFNVMFILMVLCLRPAAAMRPCPAQTELLAKAKVVVEARVKSLFIGDSGLLDADNILSRMVRADLEIKRVIKGEFSQKEATIYGTIYPPGPYRELNLMALFFGMEGYDTFEWELSRHELDDTGIAFFSMSDCVYHKFPDSIANLR